MSVCLQCHPYGKGGFGLWEDMREGTFSMPPSTEHASHQHHQSRKSIWHARLLSCVTDSTVPSGKAKEDYKERETFLSQTKARSRMFIRSTVLWWIRLIHQMPSWN